MINRERTLKRSARFLVAMFAALLFAAPISAQVLRGTVRDSASRAPIPGAVVVFLDSAGSSIGRNITNEQGRFTIALHPAMRRLQVLRIGFRPRTVGIPESTSTELEITMPSIPMMLETMSVVDQPNCPRRPDRPAAFALWEQARAALLATVVSREANPAEVLRLHFARRLERDERIAEQIVKIDSLSTTRPFIASRRAAEFIEQGFAFDSARSTWYHGPSDETLLDDAFARGYCFQVAAPERERATQIGIGFAAAKRERGRVDIEGVVWIDTASRALTDIVFRYVGITPAAQRVRPGGRISFRTMENGTVMIDRWFLRTPLIAATAVNLRAMRAVPLGTVDIRETGGEVARARWPDGREWRASLGTLRGTVVGNGGPDTELRLIDTDYRAIADSTGSFEISNLIPGPYTIGVVDPTLAAADLLIVTFDTFTAARDSTVRLVVEVPTAFDYAATMCNAAAGAAGNSIIVVRVLRADGSSAAGARVEARTILDGDMRRIAEGETNEDGLFHLCRAPRNTRLQLRATGFDSPPIVSIVDVDNKVVTVKLQLKPPK